VTLTVRRVTAGNSPNSSPVKTDTPSVKASTVPSMEISSARGVKRDVNPTSRSRTRYPQPRPSAPPATASIVLSVKSWRAMRPRPAPRAVRTASSRCRPNTRASARFATLAATSNSTNPVVASRTSSVGRASRVSSSRTDAAAAWKPVWAAS
jgi:hypothetical protein